MVLPPDFLKIPKSIPQTGKYKIALNDCGKKVNSKVGNQSNREKQRRLNQMNRGGPIVENSKEVNENV